MSEIDKLNSRTDEWNHIYPFIEWLHENRMTIAQWRDPEAEYVSAYSGKKGTIEELAPHLLEHPYPVGGAIENILYRYFNVDPNKLEAERRAILEWFRAKQGEEGAEGQWVAEVWDKDERAIIGAVCEGKNSAVEAAAVYNVEHKGKRAVIYRRGHPEEAEVIFSR